MFEQPTDNFELVSKSITSLLDYNEVKAIVPRNPMVVQKTETDFFICLSVFNKSNATINLTIRKNAVDNLNELQGFTSDGNHRKSLGILKALLEHKLTYKMMEA